MNRVESIPVVLLVALALAAGCQSRTEIVVVVDTDLPVPDQIDTIVVEATGSSPTSTTMRAMGTLADGPRPRTVVLVRAGTSDGPVTVHVSGTHQGRPVVSTSAITSFVDGRVAMLRLDLTAQCATAANFSFCGEGETCDAQGCHATAIPGDSLPAWTGGAPTLATNSAGLFLGGRFPIAAMDQPTMTFASWIPRGVNTMFGVPMDTDPADWTRAANDAGLWMIRDPSSDPRVDVGESRLLAWTTGEVPDADSPSTAAEIASLTTSLHAIDPLRPTLLTLSGVRILTTGDNCDGPGDGTSASDCYVNYLTSPDWVGDQNFPLTRNEADDLRSIGRSLDRLAQWSGSKPAIQRVETSFIANDPAQVRGVTPAEFRGSLWDAILHGARGIVYFPLIFMHPDFEFDGTQADVAAEMTAQDARIQSLAPILQGPIDPPGLGIDAPSTFDVAWRAAPQGKYYFVLFMPSCADSRTNCDGTTATITLHGAETATQATVHRESRTVPIASGGVLMDHFDPYELHVYVVP